MTVSRAPVISTIVNTGTLTLPTSTDTLVGQNTTDTLTNKTLTSPILTNPTLGVASATSLSCGLITATKYRMSGFTLPVDETYIGFTQVGSALITLLNNNVWTNLMQISLPVGVWQVFYSVHFQGYYTIGCNLSKLHVGLSTTSQTVDTAASFINSTGYFIAPHAVNGSYVFSSFTNPTIVYVAGYCTTSDPFGLVITATTGGAFYPKLIATRIA